MPGRSPVSPHPALPHPAAVQLLQAPVDPLLHVQPPLQLPPVVLHCDPRVSFLQPPRAAPRPAGPRRSLQLTQHPLAQPLSCHRVLAADPVPHSAPSPCTRGPLTERGGAGRGRGLQLPGDRPAPAVLGLSFPAFTATAGRCAAGVKPAAERSSGLGRVWEPPARLGVWGSRALDAGGGVPGQAPGNWPVCALWLLQGTVQEAPCPLPSPGNVKP